MATRKKSQAAPNELTLTPIIADPKTGFEWSVTFGDPVNWKKAKKVAEDYRGGGHDDWRLPTVEELITLIDFSRSSPATNTELFPDTKSSWYWSSTPLASSPSDYAWLVHFHHGNVLWGSQGNRAFVRAVRGSRAGQ